MFCKIHSFFSIKGKCLLPASAFIIHNFYRLVKLIYLIFFINISYWLLFQRPCLIQCKQLSHPRRTVIRNNRQTGIRHNDLLRLPMETEQLFSPISEHHFSHGSSPELEELYNEIFSLEKGQRKRLQEDVMAKFDAASQTFKDYDCEDREYLQLFAFISELAFDVYLKKQMIEILAEQLRQETPVNPKKKK